jgi:hypothetical protein
MKPFLPALLLTLSAAGLALAQPAPQIQQSNQTQQQQQALDSLDPTGRPVPKKQVVVDEDSEDLGRQVLLEKTRKEPYFSANTTQQYLYTTNSGLTENNQIASGFWVGNFNVTGWIPMPDQLQSLNVGVSVSETVYRYDAASNLNFRRDAVDLIASYNVKNEWIITGGFGLNQLVSSNDATAWFYGEGRGYWGATRVFELDPDNVFYAGYAGEIHITGPDVYDRVDNALVLGYNVQLLPRVIGQVVYRGTLENYMNPTPNGVGLLEARTDWINLATLAVTYAPTDWFNVQASTTFSNDWSDAQNSDYFVANLGGSLTLNFTY